MTARKAAIVGIAVVATGLLPACAVYEPAPPAYADALPGYYYCPGYSPPDYYGPPVKTSSGCVYVDDRGRHRQASRR
jgi:hypothetical protein